MIKKSELGKLKMPVPAKKPAAPAPEDASEFDVEEEAPADEEGSPEEEASESPDVEEQEDADVQAKLADMTDDELQAELDRRKGL